VNQGWMPFRFRNQHSTPKSGSPENAFAIGEMFRVKTSIGRIGTRPRALFFPVDISAVRSGAIFFADEDTKDAK
jgi:hypothetical protein